MRDGNASEVLATVRRAAAGAGSIERPLWILAHPDDETVGGGALLACCEAPRLLYVTDGSPRDLGDAHRAGFDTREAYAAARGRELHQALAVAGIAAERAHSLGLVDQESALAMPTLLGSVLGVLAMYQPSLVFTHPYEGGHPDHDTTALVVHLAVDWMRNAGRRAPAVVEMAFYHRGAHGMETGRFLPGGSGEEVCVPIEGARLERKRRQWACFTTQRTTLEAFEPQVERFRLTPRYDFARAPHEGELLYESWGWSMTGRRWRALAAEARSQLERGAVPCP